MRDRHAQPRDVLPVVMCRRARRAAESFELVQIVVAVSQDFPNQILERGKPTLPDVPSRRRQTPFYATTALDPPSAVWRCEPDRDSSVGRDAHIRPDTRASVLDPADAGERRRTVLAEGHVKAGQVRLAKSLSGPTNGFRDLVSGPETIRK